MAAETKQDPQTGATAERIGDGDKPWLVTLGRRSHYVRDDDVAHWPNKQ